MLPSIRNLDPDFDKEQKVTIIITCQISFRSYKQIQTVDQCVLGSAFLFQNFILFIHTSLSCKLHTIKAYIDEIHHVH